MLKASEKRKEWLTYSLGFFFAMWICFAEIARELLRMVKFDLLACSFIQYIFLRAKIQIAVRGTMVI